MWTPLHLYSLNECPGTLHSEDDIKLRWSRSLRALVVPHVHRTGCLQKAAGPYVQEHCALKENSTKNHHYTGMASELNQKLLSHLWHERTFAWDYSSVSHLWAKSSPFTESLASKGKYIQQHSWVKGHKGDWLLGVFPFLYQLCSKAFQFCVFWLELREGWKGKHMLFLWFYGFTISLHIFFFFF